MVIRHVSRATRHLLFWTLLASALGLSAVRIFLAGIADYRAELEQQIRQFTNIPIRVGRLSAHMRGFSPGIVLHDIAVEAADGQSVPPISLKEIRLGIDLLQWLWTGDALSASRVTLVGAKIDVVRQADGRIAVKGLQSSDEQPLWLLQGRRYEILKSQVSWQDLTQPGPVLQFNDFNLLLKNQHGGQNHEIHLLTALPAQYGESLRISAQIQGNPFEPNAIDGRLYVEAIDLQGPALAAGHLDNGLRLESGSGDVRLWSDWHNAEPYRIAGYLQGQQIKVAKQDAKSLEIDTLQGNVGWLKQDAGWRLSAYDVDIVTDCDGNCNGVTGVDRHQRWPDGEFYLQQDRQGNWSGLIKQLHLQALARLAPLLLPEGREYGELSPSGRLSDFSFYLQNDLQHYALQGRFEQLGTAAVGNLPGLQGLTGQISGSDNGGRLTLACDQALLDAPQLFRNTLEIKRLEGRLHWSQDGDAWQIGGRGLKLASSDFDTETDFELRLPKDDSSPNLDLSMQFGNFRDISAVPHYLPAKVMGQDAVAWLDDAFIAGHIDRGQLLVRGDFDHFPFTDGQGRFETLFTLEDGRLQFNEEWPHLQALNADVQFLGDELRVAIHSGHSENVDIKQALVSIAKLADSDRVDVKGQVQAGVQNALRFLQKTPLHTHVDALTQVIASNSPVSVDLDLSLPYVESDPLSAKVDAHLKQAGLLLKPADLPIERIDGVLHFSEDRVSSEGLNGEALGFPIQSVLYSDDNSTRLRIDGRTTAANLQKQFAWLPSDTASGKFAYRAELVLPYADNQPAKLHIDSDLLGLVVEDEMLAKRAEDKTPLSLLFQFGHQALLPLDIHYGKRLNAALLIDSSQQRLYSGHIVFGENPAYSQKQAGLKVEIHQPVFKLSQAAGALASAGEHWPALQELVLDTEQLIWQGRELGAVHGYFQHHDQAWQGHIDSNIAKGSLHIPDQRSGNEPIRLNMDYLNLTALKGMNVDAPEDSFEVLPLIAVDSRQLLWRSVDLGRLKLQTQRLSNGIHFKTVNISGAGKNLDLTADWIKQLQGTTTRISGTLKMDDFGQFLSQLGVSDDIKETHADISFTGGWNGAPQQFALAKLNGELQLRLSDGTISSIEPGFGRLLGLIAMEQWAKRLSLDFSDIYRQGLAFDKITGRFKITDGLAYTDSLLIDAVAAKMKIVGSANLVDKKLDQRVAVIPKSSDALPIAGTIVGGIAAVITEIVTDDYQEGYFFGSEYKIAGPWGDIEVTPLHDHEGLLNKTWHGLTDFGWLE